MIGAGTVIESTITLDPGTIVPPNSYIPSNQRWGGNPAAFIENVDGEDANKDHARQISLLADDHFDEFLPYGSEHKHLEEILEKAKSDAEAAANMDGAVDKKVKKKNE